MITPSQLFNETKEVIEVVEESIEDNQTLEEEISHSVSLIDGAFRNIQEFWRNSTFKTFEVFGKFMEKRKCLIFQVFEKFWENEIPHIYSHINSGKTANAKVLYISYFGRPE